MSRYGRPRGLALPSPILFVLLIGTSNLEAATLRVGPNKTYRTIRAAAQAVQNGDIVEVDAGLYPGDVATWSKSNVTVRAVGGSAHLRADGAAEAGKGIWVVSGANFTAEGFRFSGATVPDGNGAGIRAQGSGRTLVRNCWFHDNQNGILGGADSMVVEGSTFDHNGTGDGRTHNMYIDHGGSFTLQWSYSHRAVVGHEVKSRALRNYILYNRIMDESDGTASYSVDLPQGGRSYLIGNVIEQGPQSQNPTIVAYAAESASNGVLDLYVIYNTIVNNRSGGTFLNLRSGTTARVTGNIFRGSGTTWSGGSVTASRNHISTSGTIGFANPSAYDYHLTSATPRGPSGIVDAGADPGNASNGYDLEPRREYVYNASNRTRSVVASLDLGAFELGGTASDSGDAGRSGRGGVHLLGALPNPTVSGQTRFGITLDRAQHVRLSLYSCTGGLVAVLLDEQVEPGTMQVPWNGLDRNGIRVAAGRYLAHLETADGTQSRSVLLLH